MIQERSSELRQFGSVEERIPISFKILLSRWYKNDHSCLKHFQKGGRKWEEEAKSLE